MRCPECVKSGEMSRVYPGMSLSTAMVSYPYYDEAGEYHFHDLNDHTTSYSCSNDHRWTVSEKSRCPNGNCSWPEGSE